MTDEVKLLEAAWKASGLSIRDFGPLMLGRNEKTVRRWLKGTFPIRDTLVLDRCREIIATHQLP